MIEKNSVGFVSPSVKRWIVELFVASNLAFLAVDIWFAHSMNEFAQAAEWIPFVFSIVAPCLLLPGLASWKAPTRLAESLGWVTGAASVGVGIAGLIWHLRGTFFLEQTLSNLVYTAPFAAPLSYTGLGLLLILNRTESPASGSYARWIVLLAAGGFAGNFVLSLADHAQNGFFYSSEWIAVVAAALGLAFLLVAVAKPSDSNFLRACGWMMGAQLVVGLLGAGLHARAILSGPSVSLLTNAIHTAPLFAPLLFADLAVLGGIGLWFSWSVAADGRLGPQR